MMVLNQEHALKSTVNRLGWSLVVMLGVISAMSSFNILVIAFLDFLKSENVLDYAQATIISAAVDTLCYLSYFMIPTWLFYVISKNKPCEPIRFRVKFSKYLPLMIFSGLSLILIAGRLNQWFESLIGYELPMEDAEQYMTAPATVVMFMTVSLAPAFAEELLFRGVVYGNLRPFGKTFAVLGSALTFALMHQNVGQFFYTMVAGVILALIYEVTGSIWGSIFLHLFNNLYAVLQTAVFFKYSEATATVILALVESVLVLLGAVSTIMLIMIQKKVQNSSSDEKHLGVFATEPHHLSADRVPFEQAAAAFVKTKGMVVYMILAVFSAFLAIVLAIIGSWMLPFWGGI